METSKENRSQSVYEKCQVHVRLGILVRRAGDQPMQQLEEK